MFTSDMFVEDECHVSPNSTHSHYDSPLPWWTIYSHQRSVTPIIRHNFRSIDELLSPIPRLLTDDTTYRSNILDDPSTPSPKTSSKSIKQPKEKKVRTVLTDDQRAGLEQFYAKNRYPDPSEMASLSQTLNLNEKVIRVWFQNQRSRGKNRCAFSTTSDSSFYSP